MILDDFVFVTSNLSKLREAEAVLDRSLDHCGLDLPELQTLDLGDTQITDAGLVHLKGLASLQELSLDGTKVTDAGLNEPRGLAVSQSGWFVVADTFNHRLRWYTNQGTCLDTFGALGSTPGAFREPSGIALADDGSLAVADTWNGRVQLIDPDGVAQVIDDGLFGPRDLLWETDGSLLVTDTGNRRILRYSPPGWQRETVVRSVHNNGWCYKKRVHHI